MGSYLVIVIIFFFAGMQSGVASGYFEFVVYKYSTLRSFFFFFSAFAMLSFLRQRAKARRVATSPNYNERSQRIPSLVEIKDILVEAFIQLWELIKTSQAGNYCINLYEAPIKTEITLGRFFFVKTIFLTLIAFYSQDLLTLTIMLISCAIFDSLSGVYQQTLMNYFHKTIFKNKLLAYIQNLLKRLLIDMIRAEMMLFISIGMELFTWGNQWHIIINRLVSATYHFEAIILDKLVAQGHVSREARSKFIIVASTLGGLLCILHLARTELPAWLSSDISTSMPAWLPGPLEILMGFNIMLFLGLLSMFIYHNKIKPIGSDVSSTIDKFSAKITGY